MSATETIQRAIRKVENNIGWCDATGNPGIGCRGCELGDQCYAKYDTPARVLRFRGTETFGKDRQFVPTKKGLSQLRRLNKLCICDKCHTTYPVAKLTSDFVKCGICGTCGEVCEGEVRRIRFFADSNSDWMDWPTDILAKALDEIRLAPNVDVILLTKWPELWAQRMSDVAIYANEEQGEQGDALRFFVGRWQDGEPPKNVIVMTSVLGNALDAKRIEAVLKIPAHRRGLSCEPLWDSAHLPRYTTCDCYSLSGTMHATDCARNRANLTGIHWIICGCDSSKNHKGWEHYEINARRIIGQCQDAGVNVWHKQMPIGGKVSLDITQFPKDMQIRQFPAL